MRSVVLCETLIVLKLPFPHSLQSNTPIKELDHFPIEGPKFGRSPLRFAKISPLLWRTTPLLTPRLKSLALNP